MQMEGSAALSKEAPPSTDTSMKNHLSFARISGGTAAMEAASGSTNRTSASSETEGSEGGSDGVAEGVKVKGSSRQGSSAPPRPRSRSKVSPAVCPEPSVGFVTEPVTMALRAEEEPKSPSDRAEPAG